MCCSAPRRGTNLFRSAMRRRVSMHTIRHIRMCGGQPGCERCTIQQARQLSQQAQGGWWVEVVLFGHSRLSALPTFIIRTSAVVAHGRLSPLAAAATAPPLSCDSASSASSAPPFATDGLRINCAHFPRPMDYSIAIRTLASANGSIQQHTVQPATCGAVQCNACSCTAVQYVQCIINIEHRAACHVG